MTFTAPWELFTVCVLPGCTAPVAEQGVPCPACRRAFGELLVQRPGGAPLTAAAQRQRDTAVRAAYRVQQIVTETTRSARAGVLASPTMRDQTCWLCTERRTCALVDGRWECGMCGS